MTPLQIEILMHYWTRAIDYRSGDFSAPAVREAIDWFVSEGLLEAEAVDGTKTYALGKRGAAYLLALSRVPLPQQVWRIDWSSIDENI